MIEFIFTIDYEIYGNGEGSLRELVFEPTNRLVSVFKEYNATFVVFAEALEFRKIEEYRADDAVGSVRTQLCQLLEEGFEIGLHLHPWWSNARHVNGRWCLDYRERNLCGFSAQRVEEVVGSAVDYLREAMEAPAYAPVSFRAGLWLMQPTKVMGSVLSRHGVQVDSSVFKGGRIRDVGVDYRPALRNGYYWHFTDDVNVPDPSGHLLELPIHTEMVAFWKMLTHKRLGLQRKVPSRGNGGPLPGRWSDFARVRYPRKLDFCRMGFDELRSVMEGVLREDKKNPHVYKPVVAIGHTKDLVDFDTVRRFLSYLARKGIAVSNFKQVLQKLQREHTEAQSRQTTAGRQL